MKKKSFPKVDFYRIVQTKIQLLQNYYDFQKRTTCTSQLARVSGRRKSQDADEKAAGIYITFKRKYNSSSLLDIEKFFKSNLHAPKDFTLELRHKIYARVIWHHFLIKKGLQFKSCGLIQV